MRVMPTILPGVLLLEPQVFEDARGFFYEAFNQRRFAEATGIDAAFVQDNISRSGANVLRGLHYQVRQPQGKLVHVLSGSIFDVAVDLRRGSATFGQWAGQQLTAAAHQLLWIPGGFAHGFLVLEAPAEVLYKTTGYYTPADERTIRWDDPDLAIAWPLQGAPVLSEKDQCGSPLRLAELPT
jgi:dTDP-4-dehydrorhamnose 3,5-epimerase